MSVKSSLNTEIYNAYISLQKILQLKCNASRLVVFGEKSFLKVMCDLCRWVEFTKKSVAKRVANMLNGEQIGGKRRSSFYYDIWNIKYLSKFKWDDLISEIAEKNRVREQKLSLEISAANRERDFYMSKVEQSRALKHMQERKKKNQKAEGSESGDMPEPKVIRQFPQNRPVADSSVQSKPRLSKDILAGVFSGGSK
ncbi:pre-rRNA-processing protein ESF2 isoform X2 [Phoenix dactylifera]|uniref:Pre-rRNA-processing protein ESF2 isoform X2 n=1 Tax=Phoenix dactylifera TaxID=42345 RepID=A0A8B7D292_PHODC|nr:pre-rRNA-processing protein ESF2 isoform X2 [Phoenix dactylifera]XP_008811713.1 pre-rRNA-processing protein ESF2 isoform X2 [Phoenix dactylifera]